MKKALIVDDDKDNLYFLEVLLKSKGFEVYLASNGAQALEIAKRNPPDIVISDILMPVMDGFSLCRKWKTDVMLKDIPFIFYTATYTDPKDEKFALSLGADIFIIKPKDPFEWDDILNSIILEKQKGLKPLGEEMEFFRQYNEILFKKLEKKIMDLENAHKKLTIQDDALQRNEKFLESIVENIPDMIFVKEVENLNFVMFNRAGEELLGYSREELIGKNDYDFFPKEQADFFTAKDREVLASKQLVDIPEETIKTKNLGERILHTKKIPIIEKEGRYCFLMGISEDITEHKRAEESLREAMEKLKKMFSSIIKVISTIIEFRDPYTAGHQSRVGKIACALAKEIGFPDDRAENIYMAGNIHDIGKISIPAEILSKPSQLTSIEMALIKTHPQSGYSILKDVELPYPVKDMILQHHERLDGSGYPYGLKGDDILIESKILAVSDVVEAISSHRPYRPACGIEVALDEIEKNRGILYDENVVDGCVKLFRERGFTYDDCQA
ncbi:MAG: response regulator [Syntrophorhabdaceae bacterium]|nr:response regulator [Syntrophorhabdaceae bacterium]